MTSDRTPGGAARGGWSPGRKLALFLVLTAAGCGALFYGARIAIPEAPEDQRPALVTAFAILYALPGMLAAVGIQGALAQAPVLGPLGIRFRPNRGWALALGLPVPIAAGMGLLALALPDTALVSSPEEYAARLAELRGGEVTEAMVAAAEALGDAPVFGLLAAALSPGGLLFQALLVAPAEVAWRGFVHHALGGGVWRTGLVTGLLWGVWLVPLVALGQGFQDAPVATAAVQIAAATALGPWLAFVRERSGSIVATALFYGVLSRLGGLPTMLVAHASRWVVGFPGLALVASATLLLTLLVPVARGRERAPGDPGG